MKRSFWLVEVSQCQRIPSWFGVAWRVYERDSVICLWLGVNVIAAWLRRIYIYIKNPLFSMTGNEEQRLSHLERQVKNLTGDGR